MYAYARWSMKWLLNVFLFYRICVGQVSGSHPSVALCITSTDPLLFCRSAVKFRVPPLVVVIAPRLRALCERRLTSLCTAAVFVLVAPSAGSVAVAPCIVDLVPCSGDVVVTPCVA